MTTAQNIAQPIDPMDAAMNPQPLNFERHYFGEATTVDVWYCVLQKGVGKRPFDPTADDASERRVAISLVIVPTKGQYDIRQDVLDFSKEWQKHTLPSLKQLGLDLRSLKGKFVQLKRVRTGETYTTKTGEVKDRLAIELIAVYPDRAACDAAAEQFFSQFKKSGEETDGAPPAPAAPAAQASDTSAAEKTFAAQSLPLLWQASGQNVQVFHQMIASNPMIAKHFNEQSPEVCAFTDGLPF